MGGVCDQNIAPVTQDPHQRHSVSTYLGEKLRSSPICIPPPLLSLLTLFQEPPPVSAKLFLGSILHPCFHYIIRVQSIIQLHAATIINTKDT